MAAFVTHATGGLGFPPSAFLLVVLAHYHLELCNLNSSAIVHLSVFVTLCECWLGIARDLELFRYFHFPSYYSRYGSPVQSIGFKIRHADKYIKTVVKTSWKKARDHRFVVILPDPSPAQKEMLVPQILDFTKEEPTLYSQCLAMVERIAFLKGLGLYREIVAEEFIQRGVQPVGQREHPMFKTSAANMSKLFFLYLSTCVSHQPLVLPTFHYQQ